MKGRQTGSIGRTRKHVVGLNKVNREGDKPKPLHAADEEPHVMHSGIGKQA